MQQAHLIQALGCCLAIALAGLFGNAHAQEADGALNVVKIGYAHVGFNTQSGDLTGPPGTTPPGIQAELKNIRTVALAYERKLAGPWTVALQSGTPSVIKLMGAGNGAGLGQVGTTRAWFPAVVANYTFDGPWGLKPYVGGGVNYTFYVDGHVSPAYTTAFGGTESTAKLKASWGSVVEVGVGYRLNRNWVIDAAYQRYGIRTTAAISTATPGAGTIVRTVGVRSDPGVIALVLGYRF